MNRRSTRYEHVEYRVHPSGHSYDVVSSGVKQGESRRTIKFFVELRDIARSSFDRIIGEIAAGLKGLGERFKMELQIFSQGSRLLFRASQAALEFVETLGYRAVVTT